MNRPQPIVNVPQRTLVHCSVSELVREKLHDMSRLHGADVNSPYACRDTVHLRDGSIPDEEKEPRHIGFGNMVLLDFPCVLGDNPSISLGTLQRQPGIDPADSWESTSSMPTPMICASKIAP